MSTNILPDDNAPAPEAAPEKKKWSQRHPILSALLITASNAFSFVFFIGMESIVVLDVVPILVYTGLMLFGYFSFKPVAKYLESKPPWWKAVGTIAGSVAAFMLLGILGLTFAYYVLPPVSVRPETTYVTEPRRENGEVDYRRFLEDRILGPPEIRYDNDNGYRMLLMAFGKPGLDFNRHKEERDVYWNKMCEKFRLDPNAEPTHRKPDWEIGCDKNRTAQAWVCPWNGGEFPTLAFWIAEQEANLELIAAALRQERFLVVPMPVNDVWGGSLDSPVQRLLRELATILHCRALMHLGNDEPDKAMDDLETLYRLATVFRRQCFETDDIFSAYTVQWYADHVTFYLVRDGRLDTAGLRGLYEKRQSLLGGPSPREFALLWRISALETMLHIASGRFFLDDEDDKRADWEKRLLVANARLCLWNRAFTNLNGFFDRLEKRLDEPGHFELAKLSQAMIFKPENEFDENDMKKTLWLAFRGMLWKGQIGFYPHLMGEVLGEGLFLDMQQSRFDCFYRLEANERMTDLAILLEIYRREYVELHAESYGGEYPEHLEELVKGGYMPTIPADPFAQEGRPIGYHRQGAGYVLSHEGAVTGRDDHRLECDPVGWGRTPL